MSILDWFNQPTCTELTALVMSIRDPFAYLDTDGGSGPFRTFGDRSGFCDSTAVTEWSFDYDVHPGWPSSFTPAGDFVPDPVNCGEKRPHRRPISRPVLMGADKVLAAVRLLQVYYTTPDALRLCPAAQGWFHARGRVRALGGIDAFGAAYGFGPDTAPAVTAVLLKIFDDAAASASAASPENLVVYAAAQVVRDARTATLDAATWLPLWRWALGGPRGAASVRTRVMAMQAIEMILRRGALLPRQTLAASPMADVLRGLVESRAASIANSVERNLFMSEATALVGEVIQAIQRAEAAAGVPSGSSYAPTHGSRVGWWIAGVTAVTVVIVGGVAVRRWANH